ncbi:MAG: hypothetical protein ACREJ2_14525 [Planctomycetota bacterium]
MTPIPLAKPGGAAPVQHPPRMIVEDFQNNLEWAVLRQMLQEAALPEGTTVWVYPHRNKRSWRGEAVLAPRTYSVKTRVGRIFAPLIRVAVGRDISGESMSAYGVLEERCHDRDEVIVYVLGHEAAHFVLDAQAKKPGQHHRLPRGAETFCDKMGISFLKEYRELTAQMKGRDGRGKKR